MVPLVREHLLELIAICRTNGVSRLWLFGSATGKSDRPFTDQSDIDLLVEFDPQADVPTGWHHPLFTLPEQLEPVLGRPVQITQMREFDNPYFRKSVHATKELLYDGQGQEAAVGHAQGG